MELAYDDGNRLAYDLEIPCVICGKSDKKSHRRCFILNNELKRIKEQIGKLHEKMFEIKFEMSLLRA